MPQIESKTLQDSGLENRHRANIIWIDNNHVKFKQFYDQQWHADEIVEQSGDSTNYSASIGGGSNDQVIAIWSSEKQNSVSLKYKVRSKQGQWSESKLLTDQNGENLNPEIIFDSSNIGWVFWVSDQDGDDDIFMSRWVGAQWLPPTKVNMENDVPDISPEAHLEDKGSVTVVWQSYDKSQRAYIEKSHTFENSSAKQISMTGTETGLDDINFHSLNLPATKIVIQFPDNQARQSITFNAW